MQPNWNNIEETKGYCVLFGNMVMGWSLNQRKEINPDETLQSFWKMACKFSRNRKVGDVQLHYNGKLIRSCWNNEQRILDKSVQYKLTYNKYT